MHPLTASLLYKFTERIPENIEEVCHILQAIAEKNTSIHPGSGYFAFEAFSEHNWDNGVCGICGIAPMFESGDANAKNCTPLRKGEVSYKKNFEM